MGRTYLRKISKNKIDPPPLHKVNSKAGAMPSIDMEKVIGAGYKMMALNMVRKQKQLWFSTKNGKPITAFTEFVK